MKEIVESFEYRGYTIEVRRDEFAESPREWDNLGTMVSWHRRYSLGDKPEMHRYYPDSAQWCRDNLDAFAVILPLYLYDHSGITMRTHPFPCPWDSGQVGWIYVTKETLRKEYGLRRVSKKAKETARRVLRAEVEEYDSYLRGDVYGFVVRDKSGDVVDSSLGFYGYDHEESGLMIEAKRVADWDIERVEKERREYVKRHGERVKRWIRGKVPLMYREPLDTGYVMEEV
jgi:hypothetical protein